jgi:hypothetical protein
MGRTYNIFTMIALRKNKVIQVVSFTDFDGLINDSIPARDCLLIQGKPVRGVWCELDDELISLLGGEDTVVFKRGGTEHSRLPVSECVAAWGPDGPCLAHPQLKKTGLKTTKEVFKSWTT